MLLGTRKAPKHLPSTLVIGTCRLSRGSFITCCDNKCILHQLEDSMTWIQATHMFTVNPLMISCWACLFGQVVKAEHRKVFDHAHAHLWQIALQLTEQHAGVQPNMRSVALEATARYKNRG